MPQRHLWNHSGETPVNPMDYVWSGPEPGVFEGANPETCPADGGGDGSFGC